MVNKKRSKPAVSRRSWPCEKEHLVDDALAIQQVKRMEMGPTCMMNKQRSRPSVTRKSQPCEKRDSIDDALAMQEATNVEIGLTCMVNNYSMMVGVLQLSKLPASTEISLLRQKISLWKFWLLNTPPPPEINVKNSWKSNFFTSFA